MTKKFIFLFFLMTSFASAEIYFINDTLSIDTSKTSFKDGHGDDCGPNYPADETCELSCYEGTNEGASVYTCAVGMTALYYEEITIGDSGTPTEDPCDLGPGAPGCEDNPKLMSAAVPATDTGNTYSTGNTLQTWDERSVIFYPYQRVRLCFNLGRPLTTQDTSWVLAEGYPEAEVDPEGCMEADEGDDGPIDPPDSGSPTEPDPCDEGPGAPGCNPKSLF